MAALPSRIPVILCGKSSKVGLPVSKLLLPEYEAIHFVQTPEAAKADIPALLAGLKPETAGSDEVGTKNYSEPPRVVIFGRAFDMAFAGEIYDSVKGKTAHPVAWVVGEPVRANTTGVTPGPGYAENAVKEVKEALASWKEKGGVDDDFIIY